MPHPTLCDLIPTFRGRIVLLSPLGSMNLLIKSPLPLARFRRFPLGMLWLVPLNFPKPGYDLQQFVPFTDALRPTFFTCRSKMNGIRPFSVLVSSLVPLWSPLTGPAPYLVVFWISIDHFSRLLLEPVLPDPLPGPLRLPFFLVS